MHHSLPGYVTKYGETPVFTETTTPSKLTGNHNTKPGVWGKLVVISGMLDYVIPGPPEERKTIREGEFGIIEPEIFHHVQLAGPVQFQVEFYR